MKQRNTWIGLGAVYIAFKWAIRLAAFAVVPRQQRYPSAALGWLLFIMMFPTPGMLLYMLVGNAKLSPKRRQQQRFADQAVRMAMTSARQREDTASLIGPPMEPRHAAIASLVEQLGGMPVFSGNDFELLPDYAGAVQRIIEDIDNAQRYVHVEYFMFADDEIGGPVIDALIRAQQRGIKVRVLIDHLGNFGFNKPVFTKLREAGVPVREVLPVRVFDNEWSRLDLRNHRKIVVVDGASGFTGSQNIINSTYNKSQNIKKGLYYEELVARVTGPIVIQLEAVFAADWYSETDQVLTRDNYAELATDWHATGDVHAQALPSGPGQEKENNWLLFNALFHQAQEKIVISTPYFVPDVTLRTAILTAAQRGVDVTLIVSDIADQFLVSRVQRSNYEELLEAGVTIYLFNAPILLHAKHMSVDDDICVIGSSNMDMRSFQLNLEVSIVVYDRDVVAALREIEANYIRRAEKLTEEEWGQRSRLEKFVQNTARLMSEFV